MGRRLDRTVSGSAYGALAGFWMATPTERSALFVPTFSAISVEIQRILRLRIPEAYFARTEKFATTRFAYPVLVYMASRPYRAKNRTDFTYDVLNPSMMDRFFRMTKANLGAVLSAVVERLRSEGREDQISPYQPHRAGDVIASVQARSASTSLLYDLLVGESTLVNELLMMGGFGQRQPRERERIATTLFRNWDYHLRRICTGHDLRFVGPQLFEAATAALRSHQPHCREPRHGGQALPGDGETLLYEADGAESLRGLRLVEAGDRGLLMAVNEGGPIRRIHELERLPE